MCVGVKSNTGEYNNCSVCRQTYCTCHCYFDVPFIPTLIIDPSGNVYEAPRSCWFCKARPSIGEEGVCAYGDTKVPSGSRYDACINCWFCRALPNIGEEGGGGPYGDRLSCTGV